MVKRIITGLIAAFVIYYLIVTMSRFGFFILTVGVTILTQIEFYNFYFSGSKLRSPVFLCLVLGVLVTFSFHFSNVFSEKELITNIVLALMLFVTFYGGEVRQSLEELSISLLGIFYIPWFLGHLILIRNFINGKNLLLFLLFVNWASDTGAYFVGKVFGKRKLCPEISPNKTWEGAAGGIFASVCVSIIVNKVLHNPFPLEEAVWLGLLISIIGQMGDIAESKLKRSSGIKDSGTIFPGHGGMLDRIDSLLFSAPVFYYYIIIYMEKIRGIGTSV